MTAERPATGATDADIEAAAKRRAIHEGELNVDEEQMEWYRKIYRGHAAILVPPGTVIALAEHVTDAADRAAIGRVWMAAQARLAMVQAQIAAAELDEDPCSDDYREARQDAIKAENAWRANCQAVTPADLARMERLRGEGERE